MADWSQTNKAILTDSANKESLEALVDFVVAQSARPGRSPPAAAVLAKGRAIFQKGTLNKGQLSSSCTDCHQLDQAGGKKSGDKQSGAPLLTGYGSAAWLKQFIGDPGLPTNYGENNHMPAFKTRLSAREIDLLARWMTGDYYRAPAKDGATQARR
jgi:ubiquinol-cytochrome c reductase cytochrome b subunit